MKIKLSWVFILIILLFTASNTTSCLGRKKSTDSKPVHLKYDISGFSNSPLIFTYQPDIHLCLEYLVLWINCYLEDEGIPTEYIDWDAIINDFKPGGGIQVTWENGTDTYSSKDDGDILIKTKGNYTETITNTKNDPIFLYLTTPLIKTNSISW